MASAGEPAGVPDPSAAAPPPGRRPPRSTDTVMVCGGDLVVTYVSPASLPLLGLRPEDLVGAPLLARVHPDDADGLRAFAHQAGAKAGAGAGAGAAEPFPARFRHRDGGWVWLAAAPFRSGDRAGLIHLFALVVSDRIRAENWVAEQRALTDAVLTMASDAIVGIDRTGAIVDWNRAAEALLGWPRAGVIGRPVADVLVPERLRDEFRRGLDQRWTDDSARPAADPAEVTLQRADRSELPVDLAVWRVEVGEHSQLYALLRDLSARKATERELTRAREQALMASRQKSEFLATMSHEIRTPMNGVIGLAGLMLDTSLDPTQRRYADGIQTAATALLTVINDILDFSKVEAGKVALAEVGFDLRALVEDVVEIVAAPARAKGLELVGYCPPDAPVALRGDPDRLRQVLLNLASNAVKFTDRGEVVVSAGRAPSGSAPAVVATDRAPGGPPTTIRFEVSDTGIGLAPDERQHVFDAFTQVDASPTKRVGGTGLGLAICRRLVEVMGGSIGVDSELDVGSTFWFEVPLRPQAEGGLPGREPRADLSGLQVLVVDNNETNRVILDGQLRAWRMVPTAVGSGREALDRLRQATAQGRPYDVAVLDLFMPTMDGVELARRITADPVIGPVHLVLLASEPTVDRSTATAAGVSAVLTKPVHQSQLFDVLARVLVREPGAPGSQPGAGAEPARLAVDEGSRPALAPSASDRGHVLLAEDNAINQEVAAAILRRLGCAVDLATTGVEALDRAARTAYDAILMDCQMPDLDGYRATEELRRREGSGRHTPVIALTASALAEDRERCLAAGMDDYLSKPIRPDELAVSLDRWLGPAGSGPPPPGGPSSRKSTVDGGDPAVDAVRETIERRLDQVREVDPVAAGPLLRSVTASFLDRTPSYLAAIAGAIDRADGRAAAADAHSLQGMAGNLGAASLSATCAELTAVCRSGQLDAARDVLPRLQTEQERVFVALRELQPSL